MWLGADRTLIQQNPATGLRNENWTPATRKATKPGGASQSVAKKTHHRLTFLQTKDNLEMLYRSQSVPKGVGWLTYSLLNRQKNPSNLHFSSFYPRLNICILSTRRWAWIFCGVCLTAMPNYESLASFPLELDSLQSLIAIYIISKY